MLILGGIGAYIYKKRVEQSLQQDGENKELTYDHNQSMQQKPPTLDDILSENSDRNSIVDDSMRGGNHSHRGSVNGDGDGLFRVDEPGGPDLVNVNIL